MGKQIVEDSLWRARIDSADKYYGEWESLFLCNILEKYYEGRQWKDQYSDAGYRPYTINKVYETIQIKIDQFIPQFPKFEIIPKPSSAVFNLEEASASAQLKEDVLNTIIWDNRQHFHDELEQAYKDHFFRFGIIEVGYAADWILNPNAPRPLLSTDVKKDATQSKPTIKYEPAELPVNERVYYKHIPAKRFRVGGFDSKYLQRCGWVGYFEWVEKADLLAIKSLMNKDRVMEASGSIPDAGAFVKTHDMDNRDGLMVKIWHIWDNKSGMRLILLDSPCITLYQRKFARLPLFDYRPDRRVSDESFYPIPPVYHWLSPQDEINETRETLRKHRKRFIRKYQVAEGMIDDEEITKWEEGDDGTLIKVKRDNAIQPIQDAPLGTSNAEAMVTSSDDMNQISGTSAEVRGVADRTTATQAKIITGKAELRENADRDRIAKWLEELGRETLMTVHDKFILGVWAKLTTSSQEKLFQEVKQNLPAYQWVTSETLHDGYDFGIMLDVTTLSADSQEQEKKKFLEFLSIVTQFPQIAMSPTLIREAAYRCGYRNEKAIREMQKMALLHQAAMMQQAGVQGQPGGQGQQTAQQINAQGTPNTTEQIRNQLQNQLGVM